jgi:hypothetical protein
LSEEGLSEPVVTAGPAVAGDDGGARADEPLSEAVPAAEQRQTLRLRNWRYRRPPPWATQRMPVGSAAPSDEPGATPPATSEETRPLGAGTTGRALRPRRRRRRTAVAAAPQPVQAGAAASDAAAVPSVEGVAAPTPAGEADAAAPRPARPRHRRRRRPSAGATASPAGGDAALGEAPASAAAEPRGERRGPRFAGQRQHRPREAQAATDGRSDAAARDHRSAGRDQRSAGATPPERGRRDGGPRGDRQDRGRGGPGGRGRDRDRPGKPVERKLYSVDTVVDRGFDDVEEEEGTRRVHWTIVKRTTADQVSRKAIGTLYVLQRDGVDTEFPNLGAARGVVNKTIVHPEKLTRSKAEYAAEKKK